MKHNSNTFAPVVNPVRTFGAGFALALSLFAASAAAEEDMSGWSLNFTPVLVIEDRYDLGGGLDPEIKYTLDQESVRLSAGLRLGGYYAKELWGFTAMPTLRMTVPVGPVEPYVSLGMGWGWLPELEHNDIATMSRLGVVFRITKSFGLGVEGTIQNIHDSEFRFPSFGSMIEIDF